MARNVSDYIWDRLSAWGIERIYGFPGDGINGLLGALNRRGDDAKPIRFTQARHEEMAAFMACGHAKFTAKLGVCIATSGPGAIHLLNGLYDAKMDRQPVLANVGQSATTALGGDYQQEVDLPNLFKDVAHEYVHTAMNPEQVRHLVDRAIRSALSERTVTCLVVPKDVQELDYEEPEHAHDMVPTGIGFDPPRVVRGEAALARAAQILNEGEKVAILVGAGALGASAEVLDIANVLWAGVAKALLGRTVIAEPLLVVRDGIPVVASFELRAEHTRLQRICLSLIDAFRAGEWTLVESEWAAFEPALRAHMKREERIFFPRFRSVYPSETATLEGEHGELRERLDSFAVAIELHEVVLRDAEDLVTTLRQHARREDQIFHPWLDITVPRPRSSEADAAEVSRGALNFERARSIRLSRATSAHRRNRGVASSRGRTGVFLMRSARAPSPAPGDLSRSHRPSCLLFPGSRGTA